MNYNFSEILKRLFSRYDGDPTYFDVYVLEKLDESRSHKVVTNPIDGSTTIQEVGQPEKWYKKIPKQEGLNKKELKDLMMEKFKNRDYRIIYNNPTLKRTIRKTLPITPGKVKIRTPEEGPPEGATVVV